MHRLTREQRNIEAFGLVWDELKRCRGVKPMLPDKTTPHVERVAKALLAAWDRAQALDDMLVVADRIDDLRAALSTTLEPSEAEIEAANKVICSVTWAYVESEIEQRAHVRAALVAARRVTLGLDE